MILEATLLLYYYNHLIDILIDIQLIYCSTSKLGSKCVHNQVNLDRQKYPVVQSRIQSSPESRIESRFYHFPVVTVFTGKGLSLCSLVRGCHSVFTG